MIKLCFRLGKKDRDIQALEYFMNLSTCVSAILKAHINERPIRLILPLEEAPDSALRPKNATLAFDDEQIEAWLESIPNGQRSATIKKLVRITLYRSTQQEACAEVSKPVENPQINALVSMKEKAPAAVPLPDEKSKVEAEREELLEHL